MCFCCGVTRRSIQEQVRKAKGYHIVHWSGHGHQDLLALQSEEDQADTLSGAELVDLLQQGGGFIPELMFLSACHSGSMIPDKVFHDLTGQLLKDSPMPESKTLAEALERKGYSGTAARDLLNISRGHPLIMQRLADLAGDPALLTAALAELRQKGFRHLPELANSSNSAEERAYLEDVAIGAVDWLLQQISAESRRLLWLLTQALEDVPEPLLQQVYSGLSEHDEFLLQVRQLLANKAQLPAEHQE